ncbi:PEGA domain-containing protein [Haliangium sp.]|uniref:PEGA domain-containing protein n=1 Tax=Haliangium sp. TaxID=2663208 RepID=UPI003D120527
MRYRITALLAVLGLFTAAADAVAQDQASVAVLGLEVIDDGTGIDPQTTELAKILTQALRDRTRLATSPYTLAPNSERDLLEMKLLSGCADEARTCMAGLGRDLGADWLIFGKVEKRDTGYQVTLKLLNVSSMAMERVTTEVIPVGDNNGPAITNKWSRTLFNRLTGIPEQGNLEIEANVSEGSVFVDGSLATTLRGGKARIDGLSEGKHSVAIEAEGHGRFETSVSIAAGETEDLEATLQATATGPGPGPEPGGDEGGGGLSRTLFWSTAVVTGISGAAWAVSGVEYLFIKTGEKDDAIIKFQDDNPGVVLDPDNACAAATGVAGAEEVVRICDEGKAWALRSTIFGISTGVLAAVSGYFFYRAYIQEDSSAERSGMAGAIQITPTVTPDYVGAGVRIEF